MANRIVSILSSLKAAIFLAACSGFVACSDSKTDGPEEVATDQAALNGNKDPVVRYWFNEASGTQASDSSGNGYSATLQNGATFVAGARGNAVRIAGGTQRVQLPPNVVQSCDDLTIAARVRLTTNSANWARIFDFGSGTTSNLFLTPRAGAANALRFGITNTGGTGEQRLDYAFTFPTNIWKHVAVTLSGNTGTLYVDGVQVAQNTNMPLNPSSLGSTGNNFLGDSQYAADPTLDGTIDDFLVSCRAYSAAEVAWLANGSDPVAKYDFNETSGTTAADTSGNARNATLVGASFTAGLFGNGVRIAGGTQRVNLPTGIVQSCTDLTIGAHVRLTTNGTDWARIFDIGANTTSYMFLTPRAGASNVLRFGITTGGNTTEQRLNYTFTFPTNTWKHVAITISGTTGRMYVDGVQVATNTSMTLDPSALGTTVNNWLGDSQFAADPTLDGTVDNLFISCRAFSAAEIGTLAGACTSAANCNDGNPCTTDTCSSGFCAHGNAADGTSCPDGNLCNGSETCQFGFCSAGTPPLVDDGNACTTDACSPTQGVTHTPITGGACGGGGAGGLGGASGSAGASGSQTGGSSGTTGGGGVTCPSGTSPVEMFIELPPGVARNSVVLGSYGVSPLEVHDRVRLLVTGTTFASASSLSSNPSIPTRLGVEAHVQDLWSEPNLELRDRSRVHGNAVSPGTITLFPDAVVDGQKLQQSLTPHRRESWIVCHPNTHQGNIDVQPGQVFPTNGTRLAAGAWGTLAVKTGARIRLRGATTYFFESIAIEPGAIVDLDTAAGGTQLYFRNGGFFRGTQERTDLRANVLFGSENGDFLINGSFRGTVIAPRGLVDLPTASGGHKGSFFGRLVIAHQSTDITKEPLDTTGMCSANAACNGLCPCDSGTGTCDSNADCKAGLVCWKNQGRRFDKPGGTSVCAAPACAVDPVALGCGRPGDPCGTHCTNKPKGCSSNADCVSGEVCGTDNGWHFGLTPELDMCWPSDCTPPSTNASRCGTGDSACGACDCSANCELKACGDDPSDGCGGICPGLCDNGEAGCKSNLDCPKGSVCGRGIGSRFGHAPGTNACWPADCVRQDPTLPNGGVDIARCGTTPACVRQCPTGFSGPDGCGGYCGACTSGQVRLPNGECGSPVTTIPRNGTAPPLPLSPMPTDEAGATLGTFAVTDSGKATYAVPLQVPPGRLGLQPELSLGYTGSKGNGMLGMGWSLSGLSSITRCSRILGADFDTTPVRLIPNDRFCLDGQRLVRQGGGAYGADGTEYRTEIESFSRIISHGVDNGGPAYFEVRTRDGRILTYGLTEPSHVRAHNIIRTWALERVEDRSQNSMQIRYLRRQGTEVVTDAQGHVFPGASIGEIVPDVISYGGNLAPLGAGSSYSRFVRFQYESRPDIVGHFVASDEAWSSLRLKAVETYVGTDLVKTYRIGYQTVPPTGIPSQLETIKECAPDPTDAVDGEACKRPTVFEYNRESAAVGGAAPALDVTSDPSILPNSLPICSGSETSEQCMQHLDKDAKAIVFDANGDGFDDFLISISWSGPIIQTGSADPSHGQIQGRGPFTFLLTGTPGGGFVQRNALPPADRLCLSQDGVADFDRDGDDDFLDLCQPMIHLSRGNGAFDGFDHIPLPNVPYTFPMDEFGQFDGVIKLADLSGDGLRDIIWCKNGVRQLPQPPGTLPAFESVAQVSVALARNFPQFTGQPGPPSFADPIKVPEAPGACADLLVFDEDLDGDDDLMLVRSDIGMRVYEGGDTALLSTGAGETLPGSWAGAGPGLPRNDFEFSSDATKSRFEDVPAGDYAVLDLNGDGLEDILARVIVATGTFVSSPAPHTVVLTTENYVAWMNHGAGTFEPQSLLIQPSISLTERVPSLSRGLVIDHDGDGRQELMGEKGIMLRLIRPGILEIGAAPAFFILSQPWLRRYLADFNGDGEVELLSEDGTSFAGSWGSNRSHLLRSVTDGLGKKIDVEYEARQELLDGARTYDRDHCFDDSGTICERRVAPLVSGFHESQVSTDGSNVAKPGRLVAYQYTGARVGLFGRGPFGFEKRFINEAGDVPASVGPARATNLPLALLISISRTWS